MTEPVRPQPQTKSLFGKPVNWATLSDQEFIAAEKELLDRIRGDYDDTIHIV